MNLYITERKIPSLSGTIIQPEHMNNELAHMVIASGEWDTLYIEVSEKIQEGRLRFIHKVCKRILVDCPAEATKHQMCLLVELFPELGGKLRKAFMKGESLIDVLPEVWRNRTDA